MKRRKRYKPRNVNLESTSFRLTNAQGDEDTKIVYPGDSLHTVPCPKSIMKRMRHNLYQVARRSQVVSPIRQHIARDLLKELGLRRKYKDCKEPKHVST